MVPKGTVVSARLFANRVGRDVLRKQAPHGVVVLAEGLTDFLAEKDIKKAEAELEKAKI